VIKINIAVFISGRGSNLQSIIDSTVEEDGSVNISLVISNRQDAYGLQRASKAGIEYCVIKPADFSSSQEYEVEMLSELQKRDIELVALAGFMRLLSPYFLAEFPGKVMNIHPSLLPSFRGLDAQQQALDYGVKVSGCTVHFVDEGMDTGPIILQKAVSVYDDDNKESLAARILKEEHKIYPAAIKLYARGKLQLAGRKVIKKNQ